MMIWDGQASTPYDELGKVTLLFSVDGEQYAFTGRRGAQWFPVLNGKEQKAIEGIGSLDAYCFSPDSKRLALTAGPVRERAPDGGLIIKGNCFVLVDGQAGPGGEAFITGPRFSPDSQHVAYAIQHGFLSARVVLDGQPGPEFERIIANGPFFLNNQEVEYLGLRQGALFRIHQGGPAK
jgi:hypothetical protein